MASSAGMSRLDSLLDLHRKDPTDADLLFMIAHEHFQGGRRAEALPWLQSYVTKGKDVGAAFRLIAACHLEKGDEGAARAALREGVEAALRSHHPTMAAEYRAMLAGMDED